MTSEELKKQIVEEIEKIDSPVDLQLILRTVSNLIKAEEDR